jgi:hypothetical protein
MVLVLVADPLIGALHGPFPELWLALSAEIAVAALFCSTMLTPWWTAGPSSRPDCCSSSNTSSGGAVAPPLLPPVDAFIGRFLPLGVTVNLVRAAVYFTYEQHPEPFIVQAAWLACTLAALLIS